MENKEDDIENLFRERFANDEAPVSPKMWQNIKKTLPEENNTSDSVFTQSFMLWSVTSILIVSAVIGSYIHFHKNTSLTSDSTLHSQEHYLSATEKNNSSVSKDKNTSVNNTYSNLSTLDSIDLAHAYSTADRPINNNIQYKTDSKALSSNPHLLKDNKSDVKKHFRSSKLNSYAPIADTNDHLSKTENKNKYTEVNGVLTSKTAKHAKVDSPNKSISSNADLTFNNKEQSFVEKDSDQTAKKQKEYNKNRIALSKESFDKFDSISIGKENTSGKTNLIATSDGIQKEKNKKDLQNNQNIRTSVRDTAQENSNSSFLPITDSLTIVKNADSISSNSTNQTISTDQTRNKNAKNLDSSSTSDEHSLNAEATVFARSGLDSLKKRDAVSNTDNYSSADSAARASDSLSTVPLITTNILADSSITPLDSVENTTKDSVLTEANVKKEKEKLHLSKRISIDLVAGSLLTAASTKSTDTTYQSAVEDKNQKDKTGLGYSAGIVVNYKLSERFTASTGIVYTVFSEHYTFHYNLKKYDWVFIDTSWQQIESDSINKDIQTKNQYSFLAIPLQVSYAFIIKEKWSLSVIAGIRANVLLKGKTYLPNAGKTDVIELTSGFNPVSLAYLLALEAEYKLGIHTALLLQPVFTYAATSVHSKSSSLSQKPYGIGLTLGLRFTF